MKRRKLNAFLLLLVVLFAIGLSGCKKEEKATTEKVKLTMGSWRVDDVAQVKKLLAAFSAKHPGIEIEFKPTNPPEYNAVLRTQLEGGTAPDLFYVRSFSVTRGLYDEGFLEPLKDLPGLNENFTTDTLDAWATEDYIPYAVPFMAVSHGVYYNMDLFKKLGLSIPSTWEELLTTAAKIKDAGTIPFANGSKDEWDMNEIVLMNILPNFIGGREGRLGYEKLETPFNDAKMVSAFKALQDIAPYLPKGQEGISYYDSQQLFLMGKAAMFFGGSWDVAMFESQETGFEWSIFAPPAPKGKKEYISFHPDAGMALNASSKNKEAAKKFLEWLTTKEAAAILGNEIPGFFPLNKNKITLTNKHAHTFLSLNQGRGLDVRFVWPKLLGGNPDGYGLMQNGAIAVVKGDMTPQEAADALQEGLSLWYK